MFTQLPSMPLVTVCSPQPLSLLLTQPKPCAARSAPDGAAPSFEGSWVNTPTVWSENYFRLLLDYEYELVKSPAGAEQWQPINQKEEDKAPAAHDPSKRVPTMMTTADMALKMDPEFRAISEKFRNDHQAFKDAFARA
ncbi:MAG: hypothetical protein ACJ8D2_06375, partial [Sphingomicrobium sp.]